MQRIQKESSQSVDQNQTQSNVINGLKGKIVELEQALFKYQDKVVDIREKIRQNLE
jgi:hypothetical protein